MLYQPSMEAVRNSYIPQNLCFKEVGSFEFTLFPYEEKEAYFDAIWMRFLQRFEQECLHRQTFTRECRPVTNIGDGREFRIYALPL